MKMKAATLLLYLALAMTIGPAVADQAPVTAGATLQYPISTGEGGSAIAPGMTQQDVSATHPQGKVDPDPFEISVALGAVAAAFGLAVFARKRRGAAQEAVMTRQAKST
jgi:hypothetical protein